MSMTAASSPTFGPTTTRGSRSGCLSKIACSVSAPSLPIGRNCMPPSSIHRMPGAAAAGGPAAVVECVPNVSEGRDRARLDALASAIRAVPGVTLANVHADPDHHRSVITFLGTPDAVEGAALALAARVVTLVDMRHHRGVHPRVGALDVLPFTPLVGVTLEQTVALARRVGRAIGERHSLPVYYYGQAATRPGRETPRRLRRGEYEGLPARLASPDGAPAPRPGEPERARGAGAACRVRRARARERRARNLHAGALPRHLPRGAPRTRRVPPRLGACRVKRSPLEARAPPSEVPMTRASGGRRSGHRAGRSRPAPRGAPGRACAGPRRPSRPASPRSCAAARCRSPCTAVAASGARR